MNNNSYGITRLYLNNLTRQKFTKGIIGAESAS